ncbi:MAG TPA: ATP-binding protein [Dictyobacter sp.]|nr:ATP-binding protein [Dictyobacter sp.]
MTDIYSINSQDMTSSLLEAFPLPVFIIDRTCTVLQHNSHHLQTVTPEGSTQDITPEGVLHIPDILALVEKSIQTNNQQKGVYQQTSSDMSWQITVSPLSNSMPQTDVNVTASDPLYFMVSIEDKTETQHIERIQRDFLANISHELRTPLTSVRLLAETLEDTIETNPEKAQEFVEKIETEVQYLSELVAELLELSRIESGQTIMTFEPIESERMVREVLARMLPLAQRHRVKLTTEIARGDTYVDADSKQITKVLVNLVHNAIKFTPSGGKIVIGTARQRDQQMQRFYVRDTGVGIREEELSRIFERFYKTDRARAKAGFIGPGGGGTGLGLAIAHHIVETHGGQIKAESTQGEGSTFTFTLPVSTQQ